HAELSALTRDLLDDAVADRGLVRRREVVGLLVDDEARPDSVGLARGRAKDLAGDERGDDLLGRAAEALQVDDDQPAPPVGRAADHLVDVRRTGQPRVVETLGLLQHARELHRGYRRT